MVHPTAKPRRSQQALAGETGQEALYLRSLSARRVPVDVKLRGGETVSGCIEYFDEVMLRLTRDDGPNLFLYKQRILSITEAAHRRAATPAAAKQSAANGILQ